MSSKKSAPTGNVIKLESKNLHDYLKTQTHLLSKLYEYPEICLAVSCLSLCRNNQNAKLCN